jgi:hypothetical protein
MPQFIAICRIIVKNRRFKGEPEYVGVALSGKDRAEALTKLDTNFYEFEEWNDTYKGKPLMVKV